MCYCKSKTQAGFNLHATLPLGVGSAELGFVQAVHAPPTVVFTVAAFADATPPGAIAKRAEPFTLPETRRLLDLGDLWIGQAGAVRLRGRPDICNTRCPSVRKKTAKFLVETLFKTDPVTNFLQQMFFQNNWFAF